VFRFHENCCGSYLRATSVGISSSRPPQTLMRYSMLVSGEGVVHEVESPGMAKLTRIKN